jgi:hypothetical protein
VTNTAARMAHLISVFKLKDSPLLQTETKLMQAAYMLLKQWACFSFNGNYGRTTLFKQSIVTDSDQRPINQGFRPVNPHLEVDLKNQIDKWLKQGMIEKSCSPWNFGLVAAPKKGGAIRWCVDYRALNDISSISSSPIGNIEDNLARLSSSTIFSGIDSNGAFHVIEFRGQGQGQDGLCYAVGELPVCKNALRLGWGP